jgi:hypothetical protein
MVHRSRIDGWLALLLALGLSVSALGGAFVLVVGPTREARWSGAFGVLMGLLLGSVIWPMRYEIDAGRVRIRSGLLRFGVPLEAIRAARFSSNPLGAPALSLRRLRIDYLKPNGKTGFLLISPRDREAFLRELAQAEPELALDERTWSLSRRTGAGA